jgi:hypothetical protein
MVFEGSLPFHVDNAGRRGTGYRRKEVRLEQPN